MQRLMMVLVAALVAVGLIGVMAVTASETGGDEGRASERARGTNEEHREKASEATEEEDEVETKIATFGAGCFWGVELKFSNTEGVVDAVSGYMGGSKDNPTYREVCTDTTGHAEVVQVTYDPEKVSYEELLDVFWHLHDPTQVNRQGPDFGTQYRTVIFYHDEAQQAAAEKSRAALQESEKFRKVFGDKKIATQIMEAETFWKAEEYHQDYLRKKGQESCHLGW